MVASFDGGLELLDGSRELNEDRAYARLVGCDRGLACGRGRRVRGVIRAGRAAEHLRRAT